MAQRTNQRTNMGTPSKLDVAKFIERLQAITLAANVNSINLAERDFVAKAATFHGLVTISNAFRSFVIETIDTLNDIWGPHASRAPPSHTWLLPRLAQGFHWLCGAEQQAFAGYPYPAFAQVRNIFDSAVVTSAVAQGWVSSQDADGLTPGEPFDPAAAKKKRKKVEYLIFKRMTGAASGLSATTLHELAMVGEMFDWEVHGQRMSATRSLLWLKGQAPLAFLPQFDEGSFTPFMNRYLETMWMVHRLVPLARPYTAPVPSEWRDKWIVLDESLKTNTFSLTAQFSKPIGQAIVDFVTAKFPFDTNSTLPPPSA
jgi:hypothetical protein